MTYSIKKLMIVIGMILSITVTFTEAKPIFKNQKSETATIYGNCNICKKAIENAGNEINKAKITWDIDSKKATILYDSKKTSSNIILKRIALAGYDSDQYLAPDNAYAKLESCCKYDRVLKVIAKNSAPKSEKLDHSMHSELSQIKELPQLELVFDKYFAVKDALVATNGPLASAKALELENAINALKMNDLEMEVHIVWMKVINDLKLNSEHIATNKETDHQREHFIGLSKSIYELIKVAKTSTPVYYQFCPMANDNKGANWLSKEAGIKNPYFGSEMMTCGKTVETIK